MTGAGSAASTKHHSKHVLHEYNLNIFIFAVFGDLANIIFDRLSSFYSASAFILECNARRSHDNSVHHTLVLCQNDRTYCGTYLTAGQPHHSSF